MKLKIKLRAGETLIHEGEASDCLYVVTVGELSVSKFKDGAPHFLGYILPGETAGELSFLDNLPRSATVKAHTDCELIMISRPEFDEELRAATPLIQNLVKGLAGRLRKMDARLRT